MFLKTLAIVVLVILAFRLIARFLFPILGQYAVRKASESMKERMHEQRDGRKVFEDGEVTIRKPKSGGHHQSNNDEYVDFEEVKD